MFPLGIPSEIEILIKRNTEQARKVMGKIACPEASCALNQIVENNDFLLNTILPKHFKKGES